MKTLSIQQPYAELIVRGEKAVENRTHCFCRRYRGPLLLHAGKSRERIEVTPGSDREDLYGIPLRDMALGAVVGRCVLAGHFAVTYREDPPRGRKVVIPAAALKAWPWLAYHAHVEGPYCLVLTQVERLERPFPCRGALGLFYLAIEALEAEHGWPAVWLPVGPPARSCRKCGCTEHSPCADLCEWTEADLCSACAEEKT